MIEGKKVRAEKDRILLQTPMSWMKDPRRLLRDVKSAALKFYYRMFHARATPITDMVWDTLIILDGCRFDVFARYVDMPGELTKIISVASCTWEWVTKNFSGKEMKNVIYISANPYISYFYLRRTIGQIPFYKIVEVWKDGWSDEWRTVHPSVTNMATLKSLDSYPDKRHIIHYLQPHHPFIGRIKLVDSDAVASWVRDEAHARTRKKLDAFLLAKEGLLDIETIWKAYISNLNLVSSYVKRLLPALNGKICITSDHGNAFGRYGVFYGHPEGVFLPELIEVPWLEYNTNSQESLTDRCVHTD